MSDIRSFCPLWGEWEADSKLGEGSYGAVWKMRREMLGGQTYYSAVKHISIPKDESEVQNLIDESVFSSQESAARYYNRMLDSLVNEINTMHQLQGYTNIVSYEDHKIIPKEKGVGYDLFLRMELLTPLTVRMRKRMTVSDVIKLGCDIAEAISVLNKFHLVHRDIKPQNIFVNNTGDYKLGDYGTARALNSDATAMSRKGTFNYMAPEIYNNQPADIRVDIYSLGLVLYRLLNGNRLPFLPPTGDITSAMNEEAVVRRLSGEPIPAPAHADNNLAYVVLKACAFKPEERYQSAADMKKDLLRCMDGGNRSLQEGETEPSASDSLSFQFGRTGGDTGASGNAASGNGSVQSGWTQLPPSAAEGSMRQPNVSQSAAEQPAGKKKLNALRVVIPIVVLALAGGAVLLLNGQGKEQKEAGGKTGTVSVVQETEKPADDDFYATPTPAPAQTESGTAEPEPEQTESVTAEPEPEQTEDVAAPAQEKNGIPAVIIAAEGGFGGNVTVHLEKNEDGTVKSLKIDTPDEVLGQKVSEPEYTGQFIGKTGPFAYGENGIEAISGATVTSRAALTAVNKAVGAPETEEDTQTAEGQKPSSADPEPTEAPTPEPTEAPTPEPTEAPTPEPTEPPTPEPTDTPEPTPALPQGDVNGDGSTDAKDADLLRQYVAGWDVTLNEKEADLNQDGYVNLTDVIRLEKMKQQP